VPLNYLAVSLATAYVHPRVLTLNSAHLPASMGLVFVVSLAGIALLFVTLWKFEMAAKNARSQVRRLRRTLLGDDAVRPMGRSAAPS
jgi:heme exporter protein C